MPYLIALLFCFTSFASYAQTAENADFAPPLRIPLFLSGNFAELRSNHFHTGIDIKTAGVEGQVVQAIADGVVKRIGVSPAGYGNVLYIEHANGYTSVYGHLQSFSPAITKLVRTKQYQEKSFKVDFTPDDPLQVSKGEQIALSGNSGSSGGAHLHFEIRDTKSEHPLNPLLFKFNVKDNIPPRIRGIRFHALSDTTFINGKNEAKSFLITGDNGNYQLKAGQKIEIYGAFGISVHGIDQLNGQPNSCGLYGIELRVDDDLICAQQFDELDFETTRHINCYTDYEAFKTRAWHYHKSYLEPGNKLEIYTPTPPDRGVISIATAGAHKLNYNLSDAHGNVSKLSLSFQSIEKTPVSVDGSPKFTAYFPFDQTNTFSYPGELEVEIPKGALYDNLKFQASRQLAGTGELSPQFLVHNYYTPLQSAVMLRFDWFAIAPNLREKVVARREDPAGKLGYVAGKASAEGFEIRTKDFGKFALVLDTVAPEIIPSKYSASGAILNSRSGLRYTIRDSRAGVATYTATLNGEWILATYDAKNAALTIDVSESGFKKGKNELIIAVDDYCGNRKERRFTYTY